jgi:hypothetical protein
MTCCSSLANSRSFEHVLERAIHVAGDTVNQIKIEVAVQLKPTEEEMSMSANKHTLKKVNLTGFHPH